MRKPARAVSKDDPIPMIGRGRAEIAAALRNAEEVETFSADEYPQGSPEWFGLRLGIPTASCFANILAEGEGKMRGAYMRRLAGEIITEAPAETYENDAMRRGRAMEASILARYSFGRDVEKVGFVRRKVGRDRFVGCSPDALIGKDATIEIKSMRPDLLIELLESSRFPTAHKAQCQGSLWVTGRDTCELVIGYDRMPDARYMIIRDEPYIRLLAERVEVFQWELGKMVERIRNIGKRNGRV